MARLNKQTVLAYRDALIDHVINYGPEAGLAFEIKRSDNTRTRSRVELGCDLIPKADISPCFREEET